MAESDRDYSWSASAVYLWSNIEPDVGIVCACLPAMMPLVRLVREKFGSRISVPPVPLKVISLSKMKWPRGRASEHVLNTDRDGFTHWDDENTPSTGPSWASMETLSNNEAARRLEDNWPSRRVHLTTDLQVDHGHV